MKHLLTFLFVPAGLLFLTGCLQPGSTPVTTFYQLRPADPPPAGISEFEGAMLIGPIELSPYLNNPRLVARPSPHRLEYLEHHRWAEPLEQNLANVLAVDISTLLQSKQVYAYSPRTGVQNDIHSLRMRLNTFEVDEKGQAVLDILVIHFKGSSSTKNPILHYELKGPVEGPSPEQHVQALNALVNELSVTLAREVSKAGADSGASD